MNYPHLNAKFQKSLTSNRCFNFNLKKKLNQEHKGIKKKSVTSTLKRRTPFNPRCATSEIELRKKLSVAQFRLFKTIPLAATLDDLQRFK